jgi:hypothetical protein
MMPDFYSGKAYFIEIATIYNPLSQLWFGLPFIASANPDLHLPFLIFYYISISMVLLSRKGFTICWGKGFPLMWAMEPAIRMIFLVTPLGLSFFCLFPITA